MHYITPLRYPGGKAKLANFLMLLIQQNGLHDIDYVEPYAGGAGVALALLLNEYASRIYVNDISRPIYAFWYSVLNETDALCRRISDTPVTTEEWQRQRAVLAASEQVDLLDLGFATFFLNRTNRSGIIEGGCIGGKEQKGEWKIDARFNKKDLLQRINRIAQFRNRIHLSNQDSVAFLLQLSPSLPKSSLIYLDPPYYVKGQDLYRNFYQHQDHVDIAQLLSHVKNHWVVSYDNVDEIRAIYSSYRTQTYHLNYSAAVRQQGSEILIFSPTLRIPLVLSPIGVRPQLLNSFQTTLSLE